MVNNKVSFECVFFEGAPFFGLLQANTKKTPPPPCIWGGPALKRRATHLLSCPSPIRCEHLCHFIALKFKAPTDRADRADRHCGVVFVFGSVLHFCSASFAWRSWNMFVCLSVSPSVRLAVFSLFACLLAQPQEELETGTRTGLRAAKAFARQEEQRGNMPARTGIRPPSLLASPAPAFLFAQNLAVRLGRSEVAFLVGPFHFSDRSTRAAF